MKPNYSQWEPIPGAKPGQDQVRCLKFPFVAIIGPHDGEQTGGWGWRIVNVKNGHAPVAGGDAVDETVVKAHVEAYAEHMRWADAGWVKWSMHQFMLGWKD